MEPPITKICEASNAVFVFHIDSGFILGTKGRLRFNAVNIVCNTLRCDIFGSDYDHPKTCLFSLFIVHCSFRFSFIWSSLVQINIGMSCCLVTLYFDRYWTEKHLNYLAWISLLSNTFCTTKESLKYYPWMIVPENEDHKALFNRELFTLMWISLYLNVTRISRELLEII